MRTLVSTIVTVAFVVFLQHGLAQETQKKYQAKAPATQPFGKEAFTRSNGTTIRWLGMAGFLINSRGTTIMVDPLLKGFDMPVMIDFDRYRYA